MSDCTHDLTEREVACADGMCPMCLAARVHELEAERDTLIRQIAAIRETFHGTPIAEVERLRGLLREARQHIPMTHARHEILHDRIDAALAGEKP